MELAAAPGEHLGLGPAVPPLAREVQRLTEAPLAQEAQRLPELVPVELLGSERPLRLPLRVPPSAERGALGLELFGRSPLPPRGNLPALAGL